jgi:hypothetical protein
MDIRPPGRCSPADCRERSDIYLDIYHDIFHGVCYGIFYGINSVMNTWGFRPQKQCPGKSNG